MMVLHQDKLWVRCNFMVCKIKIMRQRIVQMIENSYDDAAYEYWDVEKGNFTLENSKICQHCTKNRIFYFNQFIEMFVWCDSIYFQVDFLLVKMPSSDFFIWFWMSQYDKVKLPVPWALAHFLWKEEFYAGTRFNLFIKLHISYQLSTQSGETYL